jgi:hypothetical protein
MSTTIVSPPQSFTFRALQQAQITWNLTDQLGVPITGATVNATCYVDQNIQNPTLYPGTPIAGFNNVVFTETPALSGIYIVILPASISPPQCTIGYVTVISALLGPTAVGTWTIPTVFVPPQNIIDLVTLEQAKDWLGIASSNTDSDGTIQFIISAFSEYVINRTGISSFNSIQTYNETYDGNGASRMFVRNPPIQSLILLQIGSNQISVSSGPTSTGIYVEDSRKSIAFRSSGWALYPPQSIYPYVFTSGQGNVLVSYLGGYTSVPFDLGETCMKVVGINYTRQAFIDLASKTIAAGGGATGTTRYRDWAMPPECERVIYFYQRRAMP